MRSPRPAFLVLVALAVLPAGAAALDRSTATADLAAVSLGSAGGTLLREVDDPRSVGMSPERLREVDALIERAIKRQVTPGAALAVGRHGQLVRLRGYGRISYARGAPRVDEHTLYDLASLTKTVATTSAIMLLVEQGRLELDRPLAEYFAEWAGATDRAGMTARHLLTHTSGLPAGGPLSGVRDRREIPGFMAEIRLQAAPGRRYEYSDYGMILLGALVERITGEQLDHFLEHALLEPAGMLETTFTPLATGRDASSPFRLAHSSRVELRARIAPTERTRTRGVIHGVVHDPLARRLDGVAGHAGLFSTAHDLALYCKLLLAGGVTSDDVTIFRPSVVAQFTGRPSARARYALGWELAREGGPAGDLFPVTSYGHTGFTGTSMWLDPEHDLFVVLLTNRLHPNASEHRHVALRRAVHDAVQRAVIRG